MIKNSGNEHGATKTMGKTGIPLIIKSNRYRYSLIHLGHWMTEMQAAIGRLQQVTDWHHHRSKNAMALRDSLWLSRSIYSETRC